MSFARLLRTISQPNLAGSSPTDTRGNSSDVKDTPGRGRQASESTVTNRRRPWKGKRPSTTDQPSPSQSTPLPSSISKAENPPNESRIDELSSPGPAFPIPVHLTSVDVVSSPEAFPANGPAQDKLAEAWDAVKDDRKIAHRSRGRRAIDADGVS